MKKMFWFKVIDRDNPEVALIAPGISPMFVAEILQPEYNIQSIQALRWVDLNKLTGCIIPPDEDKYALAHSTIFMKQPSQHVVAIFPLSVALMNDNYHDEYKCLINKIRKSNGKESCQ